MGKVEQATQRSLSAQSRRKQWGTRDNIFTSSFLAKVSKDGTWLFLDKLDSALRLFSARLDIYVILLVRELE